MLQTKNVSSVSDDGQQDNQGVTDNIIVLHMFSAKTHCRSPVEMDWELSSEADFMMTVAHLRLQIR